MMKTLRIKKRFIDEIRRLEKQIEYRATKAYYDWLDSIPTPFILKLHYQRPDDLLYCWVHRVERIKRPAFIDPSHVETKECYAIHLNPLDI